MIITASQLKRNYSVPIVIKIYSEEGREILRDRLKELNYYWPGASRGGIDALFNSVLNIPCQVCLRQNNEVSWSSNVDYDYGNKFLRYRLVLGEYNAKYRND